MQREECRRSYKQGRAGFRLVRILLQDLETKLGWKGGEIMSYRNMQALIELSMEGDWEHLARHIDDADPAELAADICKVVLTLVNAIHPNQRREVLALIFKVETNQELAIMEDEEDDD